VININYIGKSKKIVSGKIKMFTVNNLLHFVYLNRIFTKTLRNLIKSTKFYLKYFIYNLTTTLVVTKRKFFLSAILIFDSN
jgi:hypothetical protein